MGNLTKGLLKGDRVGIVFGTFAPFHSGHQDVVNRASNENDSALVIVSGSTGDRGEETGLHLNRRFRYMREALAKDELIGVDYIREDDIPPMPHGWVLWTDLLLKTIYRNLENKDAELIFYVGELEYALELERLIPNASVNIIDRGLNTISGTTIRNNPYKYWNEINVTFRKAFSKNINIVGSASGGKSTLAHKLSRRFGSNYSSEFSRTMQEERNIRDEEFDLLRFVDLVRGQWLSTSSIINDKANNGVIFADTDAMVTQVYAEMTFGIDSPEMGILQPIINETVKNSVWDKILIIPPVTKFVNDGFRSEENSNQDFRDTFHKRLLEIIEQHGLSDKVVILDAPATENDPQGFNARYNQAKEVVENLIKYEVI